MAKMKELGVSVGVRNESVKMDELLLVLPVFIDGIQVGGG